MRVQAPVRMRIGHVVSGGHPVGRPKEKCRDCFAKFYCSGGCAANSWHFKGDIRETYDIGCELQKKRIECAIMIKAALADDIGGDKE